MAADTTTQQGLESLYPKMTDKIVSARAEGYSDGEIAVHIGGKIEAARSEGYSEAEIAGFLGTASPSFLTRGSQRDVMGISSQEQRSWVKEQIEGPYDVGAGARIIGKGLMGLPKQLLGAGASMVRGGNIDTEEGWLDRQISEAREEQQKMLEEVPDGVKFLPFISLKDTAGLSQNLAFSGTSMAVGASAGIPASMASTPVGGLAAGTVASGSAAYRMAKDQFVEDIYGLLNEQSQAENGRAMTEAEWQGVKGQYESAAIKYGLWEAIPEALGQAATMGIVKIPIGQFIKMPGVKNKLIRTAGSVAAKVAGVMTEEMGTETITGHGQGAIEAEVGLRDSAPSWMESFQEQAGQTALLSLGMAGGGKAISMAHDKVRGKQDAPPAAPTEELEQEPITDESRLLPAPAIEVGPEGTAVAPEQKSAIINQGLNVPGMSDDQVAASQQSINTPPMPTPDPSRVSNLGVIAERGLMVLPQAQPVHSELMEEADPNDVIYAEGGPITDPARMLVNPFQMPAPAAQVSPTGTAMMPEQKSGMINQALSGMPDSEIGKAQERLNTPERLDALTAQRDKVAGNILKKDGTPRSGVAPKALARLFTLNEQIGALTPSTTAEPAKTLDAQMEALREGRKPAVLITEGETLPEVPEGFQAAKVPEGTLIFSKEGTLTLAKAGKLGSALKTSVDAKPAESTAVGSALSDHQRQFITGKVQKLGSVEAVTAQYGDDTPVDQFARQTAQEVFGQEQAQAAAPVVEVMKSGNTRTTWTDGATKRKVVRRSDGTVVIDTTHHTYPAMDLEDKPIRVEIERNALTGKAAIRQLDVRGEGKHGPWSTVNSKLTDAEIINGSYQPAENAEAPAPAATAEDATVDAQPDPFAEPTAEETERLAAEADALDIEQNARTAETLVIDGHKKDATISANSAAQGWYLDAGYKIGEVVKALRNYAAGTKVYPKQQQIVEAWQENNRRRENSVTGNAYEEDAYESDWGEAERKLSDAFEAAKEVDEAAAFAMMERRGSDAEILQGLIAITENRHGQSSTEGTGAQAEGQTDGLRSEEEATAGLPAQKVGEDGKLFATPPTFGKRSKPEGANVSTLAMEDEMATAADDAKQTGMFDDRREDQAKRKLVGEMTPEEMQAELLSSHLTGLKNRRAYDEAERLPFQASIDVDGLKWVNDNMGHGSGDKVLQAVGKTFGEEAEEVYHFSGDEFVAQGNTEQELRDLMERVASRLEKATIKAQLEDGSTVTLTGLRFSYGTGISLEVAETGLQQHKSAREQQGLRAGRGQEPAGLVREPAEGREDRGSNRTSQEITPPQEQPHNAEDKTFGTDNKLFTADKATKARELLRKKLNQLNAGLDPEMVTAGIDLAGYYIEGGTRKFTDYSQKMVGDLGEAIQPFLKAFYLAVRNYPGFDNAGMDSEAAIEALEAQAKLEKKVEGSTPITTSSLRSQMVTFASGMSSIGEIKTGTWVLGGEGRAGIGVDIGEVSETGLEQLAKQIVERETRVFIDSGAFSLFRYNLREKEKTKQLVLEVFGENEAPKFKEMDFDKVLAKYDRLFDLIDQHNPAEVQYPPPLMVMPDEVGNQKLTLGLVEKYAKRISIEAKAKTVLPIIAHQKGELSLAEFHTKVVELIGTDDFVVGLPSNEKAVTAKELDEFLSEVRPRKLHFLGAVADKVIEPRLEAVASAGLSLEHLSADANLLRSRLYGKNLAPTRSEAISVALADLQEPGPSTSPEGQRRAKPGGERGPNGEWYSGGAFIATTDHAKGAPQKKGSGKVEIAPYEWEVPPEGKLPIYGRIMHYANINRSTKRAKVNDHVFTGDSIAIQQAFSGGMAELRSFVDKWNAGERYYDARLLNGSDDLDRKRIISSYAGTSNSPTRAADMEQQQLASFMQELENDLRKDLPEGKEQVLADELQRIRGEYITHRYRALDVRANTVSSHVAGRSNFNSKQAQKRNSALDKAEDAFFKWLDSAKLEAAEATGVAAVREQRRQEQAEQKQEAREEVDRREKEAKKQQNKLPIVNYAGEGIAEITKAEWAKTPSDYKSIIVDGAYRYRSVLKEGGLTPVFLTDMAVKEIPGQEKATEVETKAAPSAELNTLESRDDFFDRAREGAVTLEEYKAAFASLTANKDAITAELASMTKPQIFERYPGMQWRYKNDRKAEVVDAVYRGMVSGFGLGRSLSYSIGAGAQEKAAQAQVDGTTEQDLADYAAEYKESQEARAARQDEIAKAVTDPKTLDDFTIYMRATMGDGMSYKDARMTLSPEQRATYDELAAESTRSKRKGRKDQDRGTVYAAGQTVDGEIIETTHTKKKHALFVVKLSERVSREDYLTLNNSAKRLGGNYSSYRGNGAVPGFQFRTREDAEAFRKLAGGDKSAAQEQVKTRRDAFEDDRSQSAVERLREMAEALDARATASMNQDRKANTARRASMAASAEDSARREQAIAKTMNNLAGAIENGTAKFLDLMRQKVQVEYLSSVMRAAKYQELRSRYDTYTEQEKHKDEPPTAETADFAEFPQYTAYRSDLAGLGRQLLEVPGTKKLGAQILKVADDVTAAYLKFAKENLHKVSTFANKEGGLAAFASKKIAEGAIARSGYRGQAIVLPVKRGENIIILSPSEAQKRGIWEGDNDKRITLTADFGAELVTKVGRTRGKVSVPHQFETAHYRRGLLRRMGIETAPEFRAALREYVGLLEQPAEADKVKQLERQMVGRRKDGLDFFPTPQSTADEMVESAGIEAGMSVLEPSAGWGHIAERIREAGVDPDVVELSGDRRELLQAKGFNLVGNDFLDIKPREFFTYGDTFEAPDGTVGKMAGHPSGPWDGRVVLRDKQGAQLGFYDRDELKPVSKNGADSGYDRILMNPPFSDRRDAEHVQHAYSLLRPGGRLVALVGEGVFFGQDKKAQAFRDWLESVGATDEKLEEGTFADPSLPVNTGVSGRMLVIDKAEAVASRSLDNAEIKELNDLKADIDNLTTKLGKLGYLATSRAQATTREARAGQAAEMRDSKKKILRKMVRQYVQDGYSVPAAVLETVGASIDYNDQGNYEPITGDSAAVPAYSRQTGTGLPLSDLQAALKPSLAKLPGVLGKVQLHQEETELPPDLHKIIERDGMSGAFDGVYWNGHVHLVADNLDSLGDAQKVLLHEVRHYGLGALLGDQIKPVMAQAAMLYAKEVNQYLEYHGIAKTQPNRIMAAEEVLVDLVKQGRAHKFIDKVIAAVRQWVREMFPELELSQAELRDLIAGVDDYLETGDETARPIGGLAPAFQREAKYMVAAWHGSPHDHNKFDSSKIGAGEGVQAYGYGLYFASRKEVAEWYREALAKGMVRYYDGDQLSNHLPDLDQEQLAAYYVADYGDEAIEMLKFDKEYLHFEEGIDALILDAAIAIAPKIDRNEVKVEKPGKLYEVELAPNEEDFLNWDKPLSEQSDQVRKALASTEFRMERWVDEKGSSREHARAFSGKRMYENLAHKFKSDDKVASEHLHSLGIRGIKYLDGTSRNQGEGNHNYVIFNDADVSIKAKYLRKGQPVAPAQSRAARVKDFAQQRLEYLRRKFQDKFLPLKRTQQKLKKKGWREAEASNPYLTEELYHGIAKDRLDKFEDEQVEPLMKAIKEAPVSLDDLEQYLYAKHAPERNAYAQKINPDNFEEGGSGMTDQEAAEIMDGFRTSGKLRTLNGLAQQVWALGEMQREIIREEGLEEQDRLDAWENFKFYVPLKGVPDGVDEGHGRSVGRGFAVTKSGTKAALGRHSKAENLLAHMTAQVADTIVRAERAKVGKAFLQMVEENQDPELWTVRTKGDLPTREVLAKNPAHTALLGKLERRQEKLQQAEDGAEIERLQGEIADLREELAATAPRQVAEVDDFEWIRADNVLPVTRDGKVHYIQIEDVDLAAAMKNLSQVQMGKTLRAMAWVNRLLAMVNTSLRPEFVITNFERDFQTAMIHLTGEQSGKMARKVAKGVPSALRGIRNALRGKNNLAMAEWYARFKSAGAQVGYLDLQSVEETQKRIQKLVREQDGKAETVLRYVRKVGNFIGDYNTVVENAVRLSAFKTAIEGGMSESKAASLAKNLTVNFNRKGELGPAANALYLFFNAGVQGSARIVTALAKSKRVRRICFGITATAFGLAEMNRRLAGDDDDDKNRWDKMSDYTKNTNLLLMREDGDAWKIKLPYGYNMFVALGYTLSDVAHYLESDGEDGRSPGQATVSLFKAGMNAFNPLGGDDSLLQMVSPTILDPFVQVATNENFMGSPIMPEQPGFGPPKPESELYWNSVRPASKAIAKQLNELTGGSDVVPGLVDVSPEVLDHFWDFALGGLGRDVTDSYGVASALLKDEKLPVRRIPLARTVYQEKSEFYDRQAFYENLDRSTAHFDKLKQLAEAGRRTEARTYREKHPELTLAKLGNQVRMRMGKLRQMKEKLESIDKERYKDKLEIIDAEIKKLMLRFNKQYNKVVH